MKKLFKKIINKLGYNLIPLNSINSDVRSNIKDDLMARFYNILKELDFIPKHIVDVGANHGSWTRETLNHFPNANYTLLEPQYWLKEFFQDILDINPKVQYYAYGAGEKEGSLSFTIVERDDSCSFRFTADEARLSGYNQIELPVISLNKLLAEKNNPIPDIIKIDAEGLDIEVLKGASDFFGKTEVFMVEAGVVNKFFDNSFLKVLNFMNENGYRLFDITDLNRPFQPSVLWLVELVFIKKLGFIDSQIIKQ